MERVQYTQEIPVLRVSGWPVLASGDNGADDGSDTRDIEWSSRHVASRGVTRQHWLSHWGVLSMGWLIAGDSVTDGPVTRVSGHTVLAIFFDKILIFV